jgi:hypothetical protein
MAWLKPKTPATLPQTDAEASACYIEMQEVMRKAMTEAATITNKFGQEPGKNNMSILMGLAYAFGVQLAALQHNTGMPDSLVNT